MAGPHGAGPLGLGSSMIAFLGSWGLLGKLFAGVIGPYGHWEFVRTAPPGPTRCLRSVVLGDGLEEASCP